MSRVRGKWTGLDKALHNQLKGHKIRHRMYPDLQGRPDVLIGDRLVIFVNGCFWHACPKCKPKIPEENREFWRKKIMDNKRRDERVDRGLRASGYYVTRIWGHDIKLALSDTIQRIKVLTNRSATSNRLGSRE